VSSGPQRTSASEDVAHAQHVFHVLDAGPAHLGDVGDGIPLGHRDRAAVERRPRAIELGPQLSVDVLVRGKRWELDAVESPLPDISSSTGNSASVACPDQRNRLSPILGPGRVELAERRPARPRFFSPLCGTSSCKPPETPSCDQYFLEEGSEVLLGVFLGHLPGLRPEAEVDREPLSRVPRVPRDRVESFVELYFSLPERSVGAGFRCRAACRRSRSHARGRFFLFKRRANSATPHAKSLWFPAGGAPTTAHM
jgi:hypothetical protein